RRRPNQSMDRWEIGQSSKVLLVRIPTCANAQSHSERIARLIPSDAHAYETFFDQINPIEHGLIVFLCQTIAPVDRLQLTTSLIANCQMRFCRSFDCGVFRIQCVPFAIEFDLSSGQFALFGEASAVLIGGQECCSPTLAAVVSIDSLGVIGKLPVVFGK